MLTFERQERILSLLKEKSIIKIQEIVEATGASESTIRRDLTDLETARKLKRIHGGATLLKKKLEEPTVAEKTVKNNQEKLKIAEKAAQMVDDGDCLFLDAGTTTIEIIPYLKGKNIVVVTNGLMNISKLLDAEIETHVIGGYVKSGTRAFVGRGALQTLETFRFDKAFIGTNGVSIEDGFTTPDSQEAFIKEMAMKYARESYILADHTKFGETSFSKFAKLLEATIITSEKVEQDYLNKLRAKTTIEVVQV
ncbi:DeoR/GlpR family DNA-binding transcription regulator [Halalkalibacter urbisdiaboli]|uniref:DeoR/GlpR family DNA-binding transcription regulator n=1 Tax=Halalkalibacter urbisdiaboli TaxID=1960589 RepID=UPI000B438889|nr:DeoR/GlpR family DNA-binding transcription regulator [Halalkalibacter urbisdiaboli]